MAAARRLTETTMSGLGWTSLAVGSKAVLQLLSVIVLARLLQPAEFGLYAATLVITGFCGIFSEMGVGPAIVQRPNLEQRHIRTGFSLSVLVSIAVGATMFLAAETIAGFFKMPQLSDLVRIVAFGFPLQGISTVAFSLAQRDLRFRWLALMEAGTFAFGYLLVAPVLILSGFGVYGLIGAYMTQQILRLGLLLAHQPHAKTPMLEHKAVGELLFFGGGFTIAKVFNFFASQADNLVVGRWLGAAALGVYAHAYQLMASPATLFGQALDRVLFPTMAIVQNEPARLSRAYRTGVFACAIVMLPMSALIALLAPEIVLILLGPNWTQAAVPLQVLAYGLLFRTSYKISDTVARATGRVYARAWRQAIFASAIFFGALIGQNWGLAGVAWGVVSALALNFMMMAHLSLQSTDIGWREFGAAHIPGLVLAAVVGGACSISTYALRDIDAGALAVVFSALVVGVLLVIMLVCLWPSFFLGPDRAQILRALSGVGPSRLQRGVAFFERRISR